MDVINVTPILQVIIMVGIGIKRTISMSNTIKMIARRKKRIENGIRAVLFGSNPHSNGDDFSRSVVERDLRIQAAKTTTDGRATESIVETVIRFIN